MWDIVGVIGAIAIGSLSIMIGFMTIHEKRKQGRVREYRKEVQEKEKQEEIKNDLMFRDFRDLIREDMGYIIEKHIKDNHLELITKEASKQDDSKLWSKLERIEKDLKSHFNQTLEDEIARLAREIVQFTEDLRIGVRKSRSAYKHISHCYDRYKRLGGNHYIDAEYGYIKQSFSECEENEED